MPSHISHALLAEDVADDLARRDRVVAATPRLRAILVTGAQGPDFFLHNHRRKPRGFRYGALLHRKGNAELLASLARSVARADCGDDLAAYALGYITHVWLDRIAHPYISWSAGWRGTPDSHPDRPAMHAFLERLIDVQYLRGARDQSVAEYRFVERLPRWVGDFFRMRPVLIEALRSALVSAADDSQLPRRLLNALHDGLGFYKFTDAPNQNYFVTARHRERRGEISSRWLSLVHPPERYITVDAINVEGRRWAHPCRPDRTASLGFAELVEEAHRRSVTSFRTWDAVARGEVDPAALIEEIGHENLNDGITGDPPCRRIRCEPLPLLQLYQELKTRFEQRSRG